MVLDYVEAKEYVDLSKLYLFGQSMGGMTVQNVAAQRADEIKGMVVLYGAIGDGNGSLVDGYETLKAAPYANGEVLFYPWSFGGGGIHPEYPEQYGVV